MPMCITVKSVKYVAPISGHIFTVVHSRSVGLFLSGMLMSDVKRYYYLKLKENYFDREAIKVLESLENGYIYSNILLKLTLISLKHEGRLRFKATLPYDEKILATITGHDIDNVRVALKIFQEMELIERLEDGTIYMLELQELIGKSSTEADRLKKYRARIKAEKQNLLPDSTKDVRTYNERTPELEIELKKEKEKEKEKETHHKHGDKVMLTDREYETHIKERGKTAVDNMIDGMNDYCVMHGKKYDNYSRALHAWFKKDEEQAKQKLEADIEMWDNPK